MREISTTTLPVLGSRDRRCRGWTLDNWFRRWLDPASTELDPLEIRPGQHVADLGTGVGYLAPGLLDRVGPNGTVDLVDPDPRNLSVVQARWGSDARVRVKAASAACVPGLETESVDRVVLSLVLCCMVDKAGAMDEAWRILSPGGLALVSYPERRWRINPQKRSLRVSPELWSQLVIQHPWRVLSSRRRRFIRRHVLQKPAS
jgi:ubiquinone/menaquinone biosynthesis C-methylase UbiE